LLIAETSRLRRSPSTSPRPASCWRPSRAKIRIALEGRTRIPAAEYRGQGPLAHGDALANRLTLGPLQRLRRSCTASPTPKIGWSCACAFGHQKWWTSGRPFSIRSPV